MQTLFLAIMQGRMVPPEGGSTRFFPVARWRDEFSLAASAGLDGIEWIYDLYGERVNPIASGAGIAEMAMLSEKTGVKVRSLCANYFMDRPFLRAAPEEAAAWIPRMTWLVERCATAEIKRIVIPLLDESRIESRQEELQVLAMLQAFLPSAEKYGVELHLETSLAPQALGEFMERCEHPLVKVTFDSGNSASLGHVAAEVFASYGHQIGSVHIKDRTRGGGTVPLGTGDTDFLAVFGGLASMDYRGDFVMEIARAEPGEELAWIAHYRSWIARQIDAVWRVSK